MKRFAISVLLLGSICTLSVGLFDSFNTEASAQLGCTGPGRDGRPPCWKRQ